MGLLKEKKTHKYLMLLKCDGFPDGLNCFKWFIREMLEQYQAPRGGKVSLSSAATASHAATTT